MGSNSTFTNEVRSAYDLPEPSYRRELTEVSRGTPMGELFRRYWHPVATSAEATNIPRKIRVLGEDLVLFRDGAGRPGVFYPRCAHRGADLYYGKVEEQGIRCCYHGWLFSADGSCLDQPCEPEGGLHKDRVRQPCYPARDHHGLVFAYLGQPDRLPAFPLYEVLEQEVEGEQVVSDDTSIGSGGPAIVDCNWLQHYENVMDPFHVPILHGTFSGLQFNERLAALPRVTFEYTDVGIRSLQDRDLDDGKHLHRITELMVPNLRIVPDPRVQRLGLSPSISWVLPIDDTHFRIYTIARVADPDELLKSRSTFGGKPWAELTEVEHRDMPGDYEAQVGQGPITFHSEEHLASTDRGITMLRRLLTRQVEAVARGEDPVGTVPGQGEQMVSTTAGNFLQEAAR
ncbi:MAG: Rieske 2Fe-2S domain-containing protein [Acidimicrobiales bacterium]